MYSFYYLPMSSRGCSLDWWVGTRTWQRFPIIVNEANITVCFPFRFFGMKTYPAKCARNLGVIFDKNFNFSICSVCFNHIQNLRCIRCYHDLNGGKLLANALMSSRLGYCNSFLSGIAGTDLAKLQRVQNRLSRVVTKSPPFIRSVPLPVVDFKICLLTYKTLSEKQPVYPHSLLAAPLPSRSLRSNKGITLSVPRVKTNGWKRSFSSCAPSLWNSLPLSVRSFNSISIFSKCLKTYPFDLAFLP